MANEQVDALLARLETTERTGRLSGLEIEYWRGGGPPPPLYRSEQLRLMSAGPQDLLEFAVQKWDPGFTPPTLHEVWTLPLRPAQVIEVTQLLLATNVFTAVYAEEQDPRIADIISYEILVSVSDTRLKRRYYRRVPDALAPLDGVFVGLIDRLKAEGRHGLYHQGKEVPLPQR